MAIWFLDNDIEEKPRNRSKENRLVSPKIDEDYDRLTFDGKIKSHKWAHLDAEFHSGRPKGQVTDFPFIAYGAFLSSAKSWGLINPYIASEVELLPIKVEGYEYRLFHVVNVIDCVDKERSDVEWYSAQQVLVKNIRKYVFYEEKLQRTFLFKTPELTRTRTFATDLFRDLILSSGLTGLDFKPAGSRDTFI